MIIPPVGDVSQKSGPARGIAAMVAATALFCCGDALMKLAATSLPTSETMFVRSVTAALITTCFVYWSGAFSAVRRALTPAMGLRAGGDVTASLFFQAALGRMHFADIMAVLQMAPLMLTAGSAMFLGEKVGWRRWSAVAIGLLGALLIVKPGTSTFSWWSIAAIMAVLFGTMRDIATRRIDPTLPTALIMMLSASAVALASLCGAAIETWVQPSTRELLMLLCAGVLSMLGQLCLITSVRAAEISVVAPFRYAGIVWALLLGFAIWGHIPDGVAMVGIMAVAAAGIYTFHRESVVRRQDAKRAAG